MRISIAMTTYNGEKFISQQLESIINQSRKADEVIICDDCSTDSTVDIIKSFIEKHNLTDWKIIVNEKNCGYKKNFYNCIKKTTGDIVFLCDQDDIWLENKLSEMTDIFLKNDSVLSLNCSFNMIDSKNSPIDYQCRHGSCNNDLLRDNVKIGEIKKIPCKTILRYNISPGCTMAFRKEIRDIYLNHSQCQLPHDWEINILSSNFDGLYFLNKPLINYRIHESNTLGMNTDDSISDFEFQNNTDFRKSALEDRKLFKKAMDYWLSKISPNPTFIKEFNLITTFDKFRIKCIFDHSLTAWIKSAAFTLILWDGKHVRFKTLLGDLYYVLNYE